MGPSLPRSIKSPRAATLARSGARGNVWRSRLSTSVALGISKSARAAAIARAKSASGRPSNAAGTIVTSPSGVGDCTRMTTRPLMVSSSSDPAATQRDKQVLVPPARLLPYCRTFFGAPYAPHCIKMSESSLGAGKTCARTPERRLYYFNGWPIVTWSFPTPSISHSILSPATVAATPEGVPVMMMSPAARSTISESFEIISGTFQII